MKKYITIDFLKYAHPSSYVLLYPPFRKKIMKYAINKMGTSRKLANFIDSDRGTVLNWKNNINYNRRKMPLKMILKICKIAGISDNKLRKNIITATMRYPAGDIIIKDWKLNFDEKFAEWFGLLNGDGSLNDRDLHFSNTFIPLSFYFADFLEKTFGISKKRLTMVLMYYTNDSIKDVKLLSENIRKKGYNNIRIYRAYDHKGKKINLRVTVSFKVLTQFLLNVNKEMHTILNTSSESVKAAYVSGYSAAEGCASQSKSGSKYITITQKDYKELEFVKKLLKDIGIKKIDGPRWGGTAFRIATSNREDLKRFQEKIGFGAHDIRNNKLRQMLNSYKTES